jgi:hypothetical protein
MAARSTGIFVREGFNLDEEMQITGATVPANLYHAKTIRVVAIGATGADLVATIGGVAVALDAADADLNGVVIAHIRGALCADEPTGSSVALAGTLPTGGVFLELVDGPRR